MYRPGGLEGGELARSPTQGGHCGPQETANRILEPGKVQGTTRIPDGNVLRAPATALICTQQAGARRKAEGSWSATAAFERRR